MRYSKEQKRGPSAVVGRVLKIYTQVKVKLPPSKSTLVKVNIPIGTPT